MSKDFSKSAQTELAILTLIHSEEKISRVILAKVLGMSTATMSGTTRSLKEKNLVAEVGSISGRSGRRRVLLSIRPDLAYVVGVDLGSYNLRALVTDMCGNILASHSENTCMAEGRDAVIQRTFHAVRRVIEESKLPAESIRGIGIGHSGVIDVEHGRVLSFPRPGQMEQWKNIPLRQIFEDEFKVSCLLEDSARAVAIAERQYGAGAGRKNFIYIDIGMGIGSAIFIDGLLYRGSGGSAGEVGHITLEESGPLCFCGNRGCLEALASCAAIIGNVQNAIRRGVASQITELIAEDLDKLTVEVVAQAAAANDSLAFRALMQAAAHLGSAAADLVNLLNPGALIFGGALFRAAPTSLLDEIRRTIRGRALEKSANDAHLLVSPLSSDAGARGAAWLMAERLIPTLYREGPAHAGSAEQAGDLAAVSSFA